MTGFSYLHGQLVCDGVAVSEIANTVGTPLYVYSADVVRARYTALASAFQQYPHRIHYALKANSTLAIARLLRQLGSAADANSIWEIEVARRAGFAPIDIVFTGVGKSRDELTQAAALDLKAIIVESPGELDRLDEIARAQNRVARVALRVNPDIDAQTHPHISTGLRINKFGMPVDTARNVIASIRHRTALKLVAIHVHVGSQITTLEPLRRAAIFVTEFATALRDAGVTLEYVDLGGGLGIAYDEAPVVSPADYVSALVTSIGATGLPIVIEPGRAIVGPAAALIARVVDLKPRTDDSTFAVIDAGMTELLRPAMYGAFHRIEPVAARSATDGQYEIVGPVCESSDVMGRDRVLPGLEVGDLLAIRDAGAYGAAMASNYNRRPLPVEVLVDGGKWEIIRRRQTVDDLLALER